MSLGKAVVFCNFSKNCTNKKFSNINSLRGLAAVLNPFVFPSSEQ